MEFHLYWNLHLNSNTSILIWWKRWGITNQEAARGFNLNLEFQSVNLTHTFDFFELNSISIIKAVSFIFMEINGGFLLPSDSCNVN